MTDYFADYSHRLQLEKLVIGLEEPISIKGIGEFIAKVDSGNGGFNVIHGEDVYQNGGVLVFKTYDKDNELKQVSKKLLQYINVNIGSGKVEQRPVIELDIKFGDKEYSKIPFSVANRSSNSHKILICKDFIQNQLDALIDVSSKMLSDKGVEVEYITEGKFFNSLLAGFQGAGKFTDADMFGGLDKDAKKAGQYDEIAQNDKKVILRKLGLSENDVLIYKLVDYQGKYYKGKDKVTPYEQERFKAFQKGNKNIANIDKATGQAKGKQVPASIIAPVGKPADGTSKTTIGGKSLTNASFEYKLTKMLLAEANMPVAGQTSSSDGKAAKTTQPVQNSKVSQPNQQSNNTATADTTKSLEDYHTISDIYNNRRQRFATYFIQIKSGIKSKARKLDREVENNLGKQFIDKVDRLFKNIGTNKMSFSLKDGNINVRNFIKDVEYLRNSKVDEEIETTFALCYGDFAVRKVWISDAVQSQASTNIKNLDDFIETLNGQDQQVALRYKELLEQWSEDPILQYQNLDLSKPEYHKALSEAISQTISKSQTEGGEVFEPYKSEQGVTIDLHLKAIKALTQEDNSTVISNQLETAREIDGEVWSIIESQGPQEKSKQKMSEAAWEKLKKFTYTGKSIDEKSEGQVSDNVEDNNEEGSGNETIDNLLAQANVSYANLSDEDKLTIGKLIQQRINNLQETSGNSGNKVIDDILSQANVSYSDLSDEDKRTIAKLVQQRISNLQKAA